MVAGKVEEDDPHFLLPCFPACLLMASSSFPSASPGGHGHLHHSCHDHPPAGGGGGIPAPPPPTPSNPNLSLTHAAAADAAISRALRQLTSPALSLPPRRLSAAAAASPQLRHAPTPPVISLAQPQEALLGSAASELGFFYLTDHGVPSHLPAAAEIECQPLFQTHPRDLSLLGFDGDDVGEDIPSFLVFDVAGDAEQGLPPAAREYARHLEKVGMDVVEMLARAGGFQSPFRAKASTAAPRSLVWIASAANGGEEHADRGEGIGDSDGVGGDGAPEPPPPCARCYPYAVCLQYQMRSWSRCLLLGDDPSWTTLEPHADSILVAIGDIAQVWSDGGFKKVRGVPAPAGKGGCCATISVLVTLSTDSVVSPLPPAGEGGASEEKEGPRAKFSAFAFEEYAWRRFHEQFPLADPLRRYRL